MGVTALIIGGSMLGGAAINKATQKKVDVPQQPVLPPMPDQPAPIDPPAPPEASKPPAAAAAKPASAAAQTQRNKAKAKTGRSGTILTGPGGLGAGNQQSKTLLGY